MPLLDDSNGVAVEWQRIELEFASQRESLADEAERFEAWHAGWLVRQRTIDAGLSSLGEKLTGRASPPPFRWRLIVAD